MKILNLFLASNLLFAGFLWAEDSSAPAQREMVIGKQYLRFPKKFFSVAKQDGENQRTIDFMVDDKLARREKLSMADDKPDYWAYLDVGEFKGKKVVFKVDSLPANSKALSNISQNDVALDEKDIYREPYRPQFHYTVQRGWLNDPNGLLFYKGQYHLFYQSHPLGTSLSGYAHWGHAISQDMVHWKEYPIALYPSETGHVFSGAGVVDWANTTGFKTGPDDPLVVAYCSPGPMEQAIAYSNDQGITWTKYAGNPVLPRFAKNNGDPKIFWYEPTKRWIMICTFPKENYGFFSSPNLKEWKLEQVVSLQGYECPDFFPMTVEGQKAQKWVLTTNPLTYFTGDFDGHIFKPDSQVGQRLDWGDSYHSAQTFNEIPESDGRRIQIAWMQDVAGEFYRQTLFNQQMSFPAVLTLHQFPEGLRICREPVKEIESLHGKEHSWNNLALKPDENPLAEIKGDLFDIRAEIEVGTASDVGFYIRGEPINYSVKDKKLSLLKKTAPLEPVNGRIKLQILVDRASLEVFGNAGRVSISSYFTPKDDVREIGIYSRNGSAKIISLQVFELRSMWHGTSTPQEQAKPSSKAPKALPADLQNVKYGPHERNTLDLWKAKSDKPTPLMVYIHGGGFYSGDKAPVDVNLIKACLKTGISVAYINYRFSTDAPFPAPMLDGVRAIQFLRLHAGEYNLDPKRFAANGSSAGAGMALWIGFHPDLADPKSEDPVLRQSSRLSCMYVAGAQCSYDPRWVKEHIPGHAWEHPALTKLFGLKPEESDTPRAHKLYDEASAIRFVSKNAPPVLMEYTEAYQLTPDTTPEKSIHNILFGRLLKEKMDSLGVECTVWNPLEPASANERPSREKFFARYLIGSGNIPDKK